MIERVFVVMDGTGAPLGFGTKSEAVKAAVERSEATGGAAVLDDVAFGDERPEPVRNPPEDPVAIVERAYRMTGLGDICRERYGVDHLTLAQVESISLREAHRLVRPYLPAGKKYDTLAGCVGGGVITIPAPSEVEEEDDEDEDKDSTAALTSSYGMLASNTKLAKGNSPDGRVAVAFGLVLAPHQVGLRGKGKVTAKGFELATGEQTKPVQDLLFSHAMTTSATAIAASYAGVSLPKNAAISVCPTSTAECRSTCLIHSGQNPASVEALTSKLGLTRALYSEPAAFCRLLLECVRRYFSEAAGYQDVDLYIRLNVFSDIPWERFFPDFVDPVKKAALRAPDGNGAVKYRPGDWESRPLTGRGGLYDYTKVPWRMHAFARHIAAVHDLDLATAFALCDDHYYLTLSFSGKNLSTCKQWLDDGLKVALVLVLERTEVDTGGDERRMGAHVVELTNAAVEVRFGVMPADQRLIVRQLWTWSDGGIEPEPTSKLGQLFKHYPPPKAKNPMPPHLLQAERRKFAAAYLNERYGMHVKPDDLWVPLSPSKARNLRGRFKAARFYDVKFPPSHPFHGYRVINADVNDLRAKDHMLVKGAALVGLDFKVAKIRIEVDKFAAFSGTYSQTSPNNVWFDNKEEAEAFAAARPGWRARQKGELHQERLDIEENTFVTPVYKDGAAFYACQIPRQTLERPVE